MRIRLPRNTVEQPNTRRASRYQATGHNTEIFTVSSNEEVIAASTNLFPLMLARTGDPNPIDES